MVPSLSPSKKSSTETDPQYLTLTRCGHVYCRITTTTNYISIFHPLKKQS